ncbi:FAD dependent oxidoreductase [Crepidotus variabilis]|uniref:L-2-hydroxyglutarate dehydrogenase, mitochondrial n=1 Tax=Crepidotus variabilis TaxID=179855 RepID=A0A9P6ETC1_9AGAR|nr:FAD dependent oxidoreductase [Crepidotus variabilis]
MTTGVVGLAVAQRLSQSFPTKTTFLLERHTRAGEEISSRNSEVIHSGLYYPPESLKTSLCLRGRDLMYERCKAYNIPFKQIGKLVVAKKDQLSYIEGLHAKSLKLKWPKHSPTSSENNTVLPTKLLSEEEVRKLEPDLSPHIVGALWSPTTGIVDSHSFMESLEKDILESDTSEVVYASEVVRIDPYKRSGSASNVPDLDAAEDGWVVQASAAGDENYAVLARNVVNASGLASTLVLNSLLPEKDRIPMYYARGSYASYHGPGVSNIKHLIYPCPQTGPNAHAFESLGTHLTLDLQGKIRFGPDIEWVNPPEVTEAVERDAEFWLKIMVPDDSRLQQMHQAVTDYLPGVTLEGLQPDYCGMRPKLIPPGAGFQDFMVQKDYPSMDAKQSRSGAMVSLLGIESPGLTASLAIAEMVVEDMLKREKVQ